MGRRLKRAWGQIKQRKGRLGQIQFQALSPDTPNQKRLTRLCPTRKEAEKALAEFRIQIESGIEIQSSHFQETTLSSNCSLTDCLQYLQDNPPRQVASSTQRLNAGFLKNYIGPMIGEVKLKDLNYIHVQYMIGSLEQSLKSPYSVNAVRSYLRSALNEAVRMGLLQVNPVIATRPAATPPPAPKALEPDQIEAILEAAPHLEARAAFAVGLYLGARPGEVIGLRVQDIDFQNGRIHILNAVRWSKKEFELYPCKKHSQRILPAVGEGGARILELIAEHLASRPDISDPEHFLFGQTTTRPRSETTVNHWFHKAIDRANITITRATPAGETPQLIPHVKLHSTRSTAITELHRQHTPMEIIQKVVGHRDIRTTQRHYLAITTDDIEQAIKDTKRRGK